MSNTLRDIVKKIQYKKGWSVQQIADDINYSRTHLTLAMRDDNEKIRKILEERYSRILQDDRQSFTNLTDNEHPPTVAMVPIERLLQEVERSRDDIKASRDLLARLLESNLTALASGQQVLLATLQSFVDRQAIVEAGGDNNKAEVIAADIQKRIAEKLQAMLAAGNPSGRGK